MLITPPNASDPYRLDEAPFIISIFFIECNDILDKLKSPATLPINGRPFISISI